jgi:hypothetical protein
MTLEEELKQLEATRKNPMGLDMRMEIEQRIFDIKLELGYAKINDSGPIECEGCGS